MMYKQRRRAHGRAVEELVLNELIKERVINPISWENMGIYADGQKYLKNIDGNTSEQALDEICELQNSSFNLSIPVILEVKCMRFMNWNDFRDHGNMHHEVMEQHASHLKSAAFHGLSGVAIVAVNKDSSEFHIKTYSAKTSNLIDGWCYDY